MARATKQILADELRRQLDMKPLDKITVTELVANCGINRQTFYYNFQDIYDLLDWAVNQSLDAMHVAELTEENWAVLLPHILLNLHQDRKMILNVFHSMNYGTVSYSLRRKLVPLFDRAIDIRLKGRVLAEEDKKFLLDVFTFTLSGSIIQWLESDMDSSVMNPVNHMDKLMLLLDGSLDFYIDKLSSK